MFKYVLAGILAIGVLAVGGRIATQALFTDTQSVGANTFTAGTVDISSSVASALLSLSAIAPGGEVNSPITITNAGTLQLRYAVQRQADNTDTKALRDVLRLRVALKGGAGCDFPYYTTAGAVTDTDRRHPALRGSKLPSDGDGHSGKRCNGIGRRGQGACGVGHRGPVLRGDNALFGGQHPAGRHRHRDLRLRVGADSQQPVAIHT